MFSGYLNNIEATKKTIDSDGWLHTADIAHYDQNQIIFITDSIKDVIKYREWPVLPTEIKQFLLTHESVSEVVVIDSIFKLFNERSFLYCEDILLSLALKTIP